ncbi:MAG: hypothetical protein KDD84_22235 [Caldilineaceae bacterium]|nr:hypothetical protein [Caldilineaceae bacterium]
MAYLNAEQREELAQDLVKQKFNKAKWRLMKMDPQGRLVFFRNTQEVGYLMTRFELPTSGVTVTLYEHPGSKTNPETHKTKVANTMAQVIVEPTPENKS